MSLLGWILLAEDEAKKGETPPPWGPLVWMLPVVALFYFLVILPGRKERQQRQLLINSLKKDDKVVTSAGIIGVVLSIKEGDEVVIKSDETKLRVLKSSIVRVESGKEPGPDNKPPA